MVAASCVLLSIAFVALSFVCLNLSRRLRSLEDLLQAAADSLGAPEYE